MAKTFKYKNTTIRIGAFKDFEDFRDRKPKAIPESAIPDVWQKMTGEKLTKARIKGEKPAEKPTKTATSKSPKKKRGKKAASGKN